MNRNRYRLVFSTTLGMLVPAAETARRHGRIASGAGLILAGALMASAAQAELPVPCGGGGCGAIPGFVGAGQAAYQVSGNQALVNQVGDKSILNWQTFNISPGHGVQFRQVDSLGAQNLVPGASFTSLNRIWDQNPSVIAGSISQAAGQNANVILVNSNGIAFMGGSQVNLNSFTASSLDIADTYVLNSFLTNNNNPPKFAGTGGFVKVLDGARITAGSRGRVMLIAPTVVNKGKVEAPDGQVIVAAGTKVYLRSALDSFEADPNVRGLLVEVDNANIPGSPDGLNNADVVNTSVKDGVLDGQPVALANNSEDKLGHVSNLGELTAPRGNVTMVGYAVNQDGIARATTSVLANGSIYLLAKDGAVDAETKRAGRVALGAGSLTEILPEISDTAGSQDKDGEKGLTQASRVRILGQDLRIAGGAEIKAPGGTVDLVAVDDPTVLTVPGKNHPFEKPTFDKLSGISKTARIHVADGARINVAGLENVEVSSARNYMEVELRGDELKDSPANRQGPLRGQKAFVDVARALANADAGKATLIARDSLESYQSRMERGVAERSTVGGKVTIRSQGLAIVQAGAEIDVSGGSVNYTPASVKTTLLSSGGVLTDLADATADKRYDGIANQFVRDYGRWNVREVYEGGASMYRDPGYIEGKDAGAVEIMGLDGVVMQAKVLGRTTAGTLQNKNGIAPAGARLTFGSSGVASDYKLNQRIEVASQGALLPANFGFGSALPKDFNKNILTVDPALVGQDKVAQLEIFSNEAAEIREALRAPQGGRIQIDAKGIAVKAAMAAPGGSIVLNARDNAVNQKLDPLEIKVADGVVLSARGAWINELPGSENAAIIEKIDGGSVALSAVGDVELGQGSLLDVSSGARVRPNGKVSGGAGGKVKLEAGATGSATGTHPAAVRLGGELRAYGAGKGGALTLSTGKIRIGGEADKDSGTLDLGADFVARGGFADFSLTGRDGVTVADATLLKPTAQSLDLQPGYQLQPSGTAIEQVSRVVTREDRVRQSANLTLNADATTYGEVLIGKGAQIAADDRAKITLNAGRRIEIQGQATAPGGTITATLSRGESEGNEHLSTIWLGPQASLDTSGAARTYTDKRGLVKGEVLSGGSVNLNAQVGAVVTEAGSLIRVAGATPVLLDVPNESGGTGRMIASDAGSVTIQAREGVLLDGGMDARGGDQTSRGGIFNIAYGLADDVNKGFISTGERSLSVAPTQVPKITGLQPKSGIPAGLAGRAGVSAEALEAAGFDTIRLKSRDAIRLENGLNIGTNKLLPLKEVKLDSPRIETTGGDAALAAHTLRLGNYDKESQAAVNVAQPGSGTLKADAQLLEIAGNLTLSGMARAELSGAQEIRFSGVSTATEARPTGALKAAADLVLHGALVAPSSYTRFGIQAPGRTVEFSRNSSDPMQPLSALGSLKVEAKNILQGGNLWAPFGTLDFVATDKMIFKDGSLTSVAAESGSVLPFGIIENGRDWRYAAGDTRLEQEQLSEKSIHVKAKDIDMKAGATVNLAGGGDLQAYEFTVGPGGSRDVLSDAGMYAILPGGSNGFAPQDAQESAGFDRAAGDAVYLSGMPGLAAGVYTLLPAHYALLPGAYAIKLNSGSRDPVPGQGYLRQDGARIVAGYMTDSRSAAPRDARWSGFEVLTQEQVRERSELALTRASAFFADARNRPQDAGLLAISTTGGLNLDANYLMAAASGGRGGAADLSAPKLAISSGNPVGIDKTATRIEADKLNALGAESLFLGGSRSAGKDTTTLTVTTDELTLANDANHALKGPEIILAAKDKLTLKSGSMIDAQGKAGDAGAYAATGDGALLRAASTAVDYERSGASGTRGTLIAEAGSTVRAADSILLDATRTNDFKGSTRFVKDGAPVAGNLAINAARMNFGVVPAATPGLTFSQTELNGFDALNSLALTSYSTFDLYGGVAVGGADSSGKPTLQRLTLKGAGLAGIGNSGQTANLRAREMLIENPANTSYAAAGAPGNGTLAIAADTLTLGKGDKEIRGYSKVNIQANELVARGAGQNGAAKTTFGGDVNLAVARVRGEQNSDQELIATGALNASRIAADRALALNDALGAKWAFSGADVLFSTQASLPSGAIRLTATGGKLELGAAAELDVAGRSVAFFDVTRPAPAGKVELVSVNDGVILRSGAKVDVSAAAGGDAGELVIRAEKGKVDIAAGTLNGQSPVDASGMRGEGARFDLDTGALANFSALNTELNSGGFDGSRKVRVRNGDVTVAAADRVKAKDVHIAADAGKLDVAGRIDASGEDAGSIGLYAKGNVNILAGAQLDAHATGIAEKGGKVEIGTVAGRLNLAGGSAIDVGAGSGGEGGEVLLRAPRTGGGAGDDVAIDTVNSSISGAKSIGIEAVKVYDGISSLDTSGSGSTLSLDTINSDNTAFAANASAIKTRLGKNGDAGFHLLNGVEVRSAGDLTLSKDWNLATSRAGGEPGVLTLRATGDLKLDNNLSDGFDVATAMKGSTPATLLNGDSWRYRLIAGADQDAADPLAVKSANDVVLAAGKLVRTGTGDIRIASGGNIKLADSKSAIYTAGRRADPVAGFVDPINAQFSAGGGDISLAALGDITGTPSTQLYSNWLFRQGSMNTAGNSYAMQPAWWVRFDQFQQGVGALGGGNVTLKAGGDVKNVSASTPTQARMASATPDAGKLIKTGGGDVRVETGKDLLGGQYYADRGELVLKAGGKIDSGQKVNNKPLYTILALGDAQARVQAQGDVNIHAIINPHLVVQSAGSGSNVNIANAASPSWSLFSTYGENSGASLTSLTGDVASHNAAAGSNALASLVGSSSAYRTPTLFSISPPKYSTSSGNILPASLAATAFQGDVSLGALGSREAFMTPSEKGDLNVFAARSVMMPGKLTMSDMDPASIPDAVKPGSLSSQFTPTASTAHAAIPVHANSVSPARIYAVAGDVTGALNATNLTLPKAVNVRAGQDVSNLGISVQHVGSAAVSRIEAGRDVKFSSGKSRLNQALVWVAGPGRLEVTAGRNVDLGTSAGIVSRGNLDNVALPAGGAEIHVAAGVGANGIDYAGAVDRLIAKLESGTADDATLWQARWLSGNTGLDANDAMAAVKAVDALSPELQRERVREMMFTALRTTGRDSNDRASQYAGEYARGYAALELVFPGIGEKNPDGSFKNYRGDINLFASRILTERGGDIEFMTPGGKLIVGLSNTPKEVLATETPGKGVGLKDSGVLGMATVEAGDIRGFARGDILVNQSRILTVAGGDVLLWSSEGDIDAGKGKKTATSVPPPLIQVDKDGNVTQILQGAATGSGIGALKTGTLEAGDVDLIAPKGTVNAGDAGIRARNLNIAAQVVLGADNISVSGTSSGTPVADMSAVTATTSGATSAGNDVSKTTEALSQNLADAARAAEELKKAFKPTFISAEVIGHGD